MFGRVSVVAVLVQPVPQDLDRLLGQIPPPLPLPVTPAAGRQVERGVHAVLVVRFTPRQHHQTCTMTGERESGREGKGMRRNVHPLNPDTLSSVCQPRRHSRSPNTECLGGS